MNTQIQSLALIGCAVLALVGCGGGGGSSASSTTTIQGIATSSSAAVVSATE